jgi:radical SAM superfamily enzyme YgiQ (UPF0313 family)
MRVVLISPYEIGRQPFGLAEPAAWLGREGCEVRCLDLSIEKLDAHALAKADLVAIYVAMHTATRMAAEALPRIRAQAPDAHLCVYGLYAPMNEEFFRARGVGTVLGGEFEPGLVSLVQRLRAGKGATQTEPVVSTQHVEFIAPDRTGLPALERYANLVMPDGTRRTVAFAEASRGCKHLCRHCPVVPVYQGKFRIVPVEIVMADIRQQIARGAQHVSFGDPDFLNGPTHALRVVRALHAEFPETTYDATIKIQHIVEHAELLPALGATGCLFITSAVESVDDAVLEKLAKQHTRADFVRALELTRTAGIALAPTFVPFTPWTTLDGYLDLLRTIVALDLFEAVPPVQLAIRLLVPRGSYLLQLAGFESFLEPFDPRMLGYPWRHADPAVDALQRDVERIAAEGDREGRARCDVFEAIWRGAHAAANLPATTVPHSPSGTRIPRLSENWYCCAEPTTQQLHGW